MPKTKQTPPTAVSAGPTCSPSFDDSERCLKLRKKSKLGNSLTPEEQLFCHRIFREYGQWYSDMSEVVFRETAPFGAQVAVHEIKGERQR